MEYSHSIGEYVVYKKHGIYEITDIKKDRIFGAVATYYVLKSVYDSNSTVYVPADKEALVGQMEHILSVKEIDEIIDKSRECPMEWIDTTQERSEFFEEVIGSEDLCRILSMLRLLTAHKEEAALTKAKTFAHDERMLASAQRIITEAFAFSLGLDRKEVIPYILEKVSV